VFAAADLLHATASALRCITVKINPSGQCNVQHR
jgi:hypothetical protein